MKVVLLRDVPKLGKKYEVKDVKDGLARNFLIPKKLVEIVTPALLKKIELLKEHSKKEIEEKNILIKSMLEKVSGQPITIKAKANEQGILFASVTSKEVKEAIQSQFQIHIPLEWIDHVSIKKTGEHSVSIGNGSINKSLKISITS